MPYLTDDQMARVAELAEHETVAAIARAIRAPYFTVHKAVQRVRDHGWATNVCYRDCTRCGRRFASQTVNPWDVCGEACWLERQRERARRRRLAHPGQSTPYVRAWRERNPLKVLAARIRDSDRYRGQSRRLTDEQKRRHSAVAGRGRRAKNEATRELAERLGRVWTADDEQYIVEHPELTNTSIAYELGRTYSAVHGRRTLLRKAGRIPP